MYTHSFLEMAKFEKKHWWYHGRRKIIKLFLKKLKLNKDVKILEIGCGTGANIPMLAEFGSVFTMEPSEDAIYYLKKKNFKNINFKKGECPKDINYEIKFDLVCMFDVLEHIEKDEETILKILNILNENGRLFITVPAYQWLWSQHDNNLMHKRRYNKNSLIKYFNNYEVIEEHFTYFNSILFPFAVIDRFKNKFFKKNKINSKFPNLCLNYIFKKLFILEIFFLKYFNFLFGLSLLLIIKKK